MEMITPVISNLWLMVAIQTDKHFQCTKSK
jgi:hypothetical protein